MRNFTPLHLIEQGKLDGPTLIFIPGLGGTTRYFEKYLGPLTEANHLVIVDPLGFGDSPKPWTRYTIDRHVDALYETFKNKQSFALVGHSMGALLAIAYAARHPEQVNRLVLIGLPFFGSAENAQHFFRSQPIPYGWFFSNMVLAGVICILSRRVFAWLVPYYQPKLPREVSADIVKHSWRSFTSSFWEVICNYAVARDADALCDGLPVLCIHGDRDETAPVTGMLQLAEGRLTWRTLILPGMDHHLLFQIPDVCNAAIASG